MSKVLNRTNLLTLAAGLAFGAVAALLVKAGNPGNMGVCVACFVRDTAGVFGGAALNMGGVAYVRPEILGILLGAAVAAAAGREWRPRGGKAFPLRFVLGFVFMLAALVFLGCTVRAWLRLAGGDLNAAVGLAGLVAGVGAGALALRAGFDPGRSRTLPAAAGLAGPAMAVALLAVALLAAAGALPSFLTVAPGAKRAPLFAALAAGLLLGAVAQRSRLCTTGGIRDLFLGRGPGKLLGAVGILAGALALNALLGQLRLGFEGQPVAHVDAAGNFAAMAVAGFAAILMGGCPLRQLVMAGEGDLDAVGAVLGMATAAALAHGLGAASSPKGLGPLGWPALGLGAAVLVAVALARRARSAPAASAEPAA